MVSSWLHRSPGGGDGEPHSEEHRYAVRWRQVSEFAVLVELRLFDDFLTPLLVDRVAFGNRERLGMVTLRVEGIQEVASVNLAGITGRPSKGWRLRFPEGVTFKRGDVFMPWPDPYLLLGSILCYGIAPRLIAWLICWQQSRRHRPALNLALPYYQNIIQKWQQQIIDDSSDYQPDRPIIAPSKIPPEIQAALNAAAIQIQPYEHAADALAQLSGCLNGKRTHYSGLCQAWDFRLPFAGKSSGIDGQPA